MIYMDNAAMMKPTEGVIDAVTYVMENYWGNPSGAYGFGKSVKEDIEWAKQSVANLIGAEPSEIHFTSGATESANILINSLKERGDVYITAVEHPCIMASGGFVVGILPLCSDGTIYTSILPLFN